MSSAGKESAAPDFASHAAEDRESAETAFKKLSTLNGYARTFSVFAGDTMDIHVARKPRSLRWPRALYVRAVHVENVEVRDAVTGALVSSFKPDGRPRILEQEPADHKDEGARYRCVISMDTSGWPPAVYECVVTDTVGGKSQDIFFNLKPRSVDEYDLLCVLPTFTWHAYSRVGGGSFYGNSQGWVRTICTRRPLCRQGDNAIDAALPFLAAFAGEKVKYACVDSWDLHRALLPEGRVPVMALLTHDEYWSAAMREVVSMYLRHRGVLLIMAGNVCWWQIEVEGDNLSVNKEPGLYAFRWSTRGMPEEKTFLSSFRFGGYALDHARRKPSVAPYILKFSDAEVRAAGALTVVKPDHPLFRGVTLGPGNTFGGEVPIVYREVDAIPLKPDGGVDRNWYDADEIDPEIIATGLTVTATRYAPVERVGVVAEGFIRRGFVLHMGSFGWSLGLARKNEVVKRVVLNAYHHCRSKARGRKDK